MSRRITLQKVTMSQLTLALLGVWMAAAAVFGILYWQRHAPGGVEALAAVPRRLANQPPEFLGHLKVAPESALSEPLAVDVGDDGRIYVADSGNSAIKVFDQEGQLLLSFGKKGQGDGDLEYPSALRVHQGRVYVADFRNRRVAVFSTEGRFLQNLTQGQGAEPLVPLAVDLDEQGNVYVADRSHRVIVLDAQGKFLRSFGRGGSENGQLAYPNGILVQGEKVYVADSGNSRVQAFTTSGEYLSKLEGFANPRGLAVDSQGRLYVVDPLAHSVSVFSREGTKLFTFGSRGLEGGRFNFPNGVAVDAQDRIYIADRENDRISVWR